MSETDEVINPMRLSYLMRLTPIRHGERRQDAVNFDGDTACKEISVSEIIMEVNDPHEPRLIEFFASHSFRADIQPRLKPVARVMFSAW